MRKSNATALVNQIHRWPCPGVVPFPIREIIVERNMIRNIEATDSFLDIRRLMLIIEFGRVNADDDQTAAGVSIVPLPQTRQSVSTIDSAECPKLDQHNLAAQIVPIELWRIEPGLAFDSRSDRIIHFRFSTGFHPFTSICPTLNIRLERREYVRRVMRREQTERNQREGEYESKRRFSFHLSTLPQLYYAPGTYIRLNSSLQIDYEQKKT